ncbi:MAG: hypothetical protein KDB21_20980, partial [Acidimicrobiales bacterium]|nr:hypothetical protein [Acidimicrobiales bacterium]
MSDSEEYTMTPTTPRRPRWMRLSAVALAGGLVLAACSGDDDDGTISSGADSATTDSADGSVDMMGAFGPGCGAVPADGDGSFAGMADDPAATAASNNPVLSTLVSAVTEAGLVDTLNGD